ncbi:MAG: diguanylate cyclase [Deltaproteobacteria bacterium]|nr:diguanylate cyclase [Deltaproteobacteria bacterium]
MIISELMTKVVAGIAPNDMFSAAVSLMREKNLSCMLVREKGKPKGIVTERDAVRFFAGAMAPGSDSTMRFCDVPVSEVMTPDPVCVQETTSLYDALLLSRSRNLRHLPVVDQNGMLVGLVTQTDMVNAYVKLIERQTELETANQALQLLSYEDALMGIGNRRAMEVELRFTEASARRYNQTYAVALVDVDYFKQYNDHYGHQAGDAALVAIAKAITLSKRDSDRLYRYGGEEIILLLPETSGSHALAAADKARKAVQALGIPHEKSTFGLLTVSIGVASEQQDGWQSLINRADQALYSAKESGRNTVCD